MRRYGFILKWQLAFKVGVIALLLSAVKFLFIYIGLELFNEPLAKIGKRADIGLLGDMIVPLSGRFKGIMQVAREYNTAAADWGRL